MIEEEINNICAVLGVTPTKEQIDDLKLQLAGYALAVTLDKKLQEEAFNAQKH